MRDTTPAALELQADAIRRTAPIQRLSHRYPRILGLARWLSCVVLLTSCRTAAPTTGDDQIARQFDRREVRIRMRDSAELFTVILTPKNANGSLPFILSRTPYGTAGWGGTSRITYGFQELMKEGYIFVFQDIRGRFQSRGTFVMNRPPCAQRGAGCVDEATDTWDTVEWLLHNVPNNNGRVGQLGISYPGWLANATAFEPHPAIKALSPQATMGDVWMGDDFFHQGAFRLSYGLEYAWDMEASPDQSKPPTPGRYDTYDWYLSFPTLSALSAAVGANAWPTWRLFATHPAYDSVWSSRAIPRRLTSAPVPTLNVGGFWDQEDIYGTAHAYAAMEAGDSAHRDYLVIGPWYHGQWFLEAGDSLGAVRFGSATGETYRRDIEAPWFAYWLKDKGDGRFPEARVFDAGARQWRSFDAWPAPTATTRNLYFLDGGRLAFDPPAGAGGSDQFVSDPAHPVPYRRRPIEWTYDPRGSNWDTWMTEDQRFADSRPDVLVWQTGPLAGDVTLAGSIVAKLFASTTGSDADWVVKLIDVYPDSIADRPRMGGFELMVVGEIMRGRYWRGWDRSTPIPANTVTPFTVDLHQQAYTFQRGHRIMVQVQSTWFPVHDRNPQTFVPNIFEARAQDYRAQTHRVYRTARYPSHLALDVLP